MYREAPPHHFLERVYASVTPQDTSIMYEGQVAMHVLLVDQLPNAYDDLADGIKSSRAWRAILTPMFRVRQLSDSSAAVRTPSFMPRGSLEHLWVRRRGELSGGSSNPQFAGVWITGLRGTLAHHSNGQAGCFREGFEPVDARANECRPIPGADTTTVRLNRADGDFSSTFVNLMLHVNRMNRDGAGRATQSLGAAFSVDLHPPGFFGGLSPEQRSLYGSWRARVQLEGMLASGTTCEDTPSPPRRCWLRGRTRLTLEGERAPDNPGDLAARIRPRVLPYRISVEASHSLATLLGAGAFAKLHDGQDYYNIGFVHRRRVFMIGAMLDLSGIDAIVKK